LRDADEILRSRRFATACFRALGKIHESDIGDDGVPRNDPFFPYSTYFGTYDQQNELMATTRLIWSPQSSVDDLRLPVSALNGEVQERLRACGPGEIGEIGSLAKVAGASSVTTIKVLRELFDYADTHDINYLVCGLDPQVVRKSYGVLFGTGLQPLHDEQLRFPGIQGVQCPYIIDVPVSYRARQEVVRTSQSLGERAVGMFVRSYLRSQVEGAC
jgi:hypothetical protein